jgi:YihY family inner membrane protein
MATVQRFRRDRAGKLGALIAYYGFLSLFPLLLVFVTVASWVLAGHPDWQDRLVDSALAQFPVIGDQLRDNVGELHGSAVALALGIVVAVWAGLGVAQAIQDALATIWGTPAERRRGFVHSRVRSFTVLLAIAVGVVATAVLTGLVGLLHATPVVAQLAALAMSYLVALLLFLVTFRVLTPGSPSTRDVAPGAAFAAVGWVVLQLAGALLLDRQVRHASALYGVFGLVIGLLTWLHLQAQISTFGAEINATLRDRREAVRSLGHAGAQVEQGLAQDS